MDSSITGSLILYCSLDQFPKSIKRQRSLQKGNSGSVSESTGFRQIGHRRVIRPSIPQSEAELCSAGLYCTTKRRIVAQSVALLALTRLDRSNHVLRICI